MLTASRAGVAGGGLMALGGDEEEEGGSLFLPVLLVWLCCAGGGVVAGRLKDSAESLRPVATAWSALRPSSTPTLRQRRQLRCLAAATIAAVLTVALLYDSLVLGGRAGPRWLPATLLSWDCPAVTAPPANLTLLGAEQRRQLASIASENAVLEARFRQRSRPSPAVLFLHFHKSGGTTCCEAANANGERTPVTAGAGTGVMTATTLNCNLCWEHAYSAELAYGYGRPDCPFEESATTGTETQQRKAWQKISADSSGPRLSFFAVETPRRALATEFLAGPDRPWLYATVVRDPYDTLLSDYRMMCDHGRLRTGTAARVSRPTTCDAAAGSVFAFARLSLAQGTLVGGLVESLTGLPGGTLARASFPREAAGPDGSGTGPPGQRIFDALHQPHGHTRESVLALTVPERARLLVAEAKWRLAHFSLVATVEGFGAGLAVAGARFGWSELNPCALRRGTRRDSEMRESEEYKRDREFRAWLAEQYRYDLEVYEHAKALARWQYDGLAAMQA